MEKIGEQLKDKSVEFQREVREKTLGYILTSFGLVAGLAWNETIKAFIEAFSPMQQDTLKAKFVYSIVITLVVVFVTLYLSRLFRKDAQALEAESLKKKKKQKTKK